MNRDGVFVDTGAWIGLLSPRDTHYSSATLLFSQARRERVPLFITSAVITEVLDGAAERDRRTSGLLRRAIERFEVEVVHINESLLERGWQLFDARRDKEWSLTECLSFVVMREFDISDAFAHDHHFEQAGFRALLRG